MRIALVTPEFITGERFDGGLANYVYRLGQSLVSMGHQPVIFVPGPEDDQFNKDGLTVFQIEIASSQAVAQWRSKKRWKRILRKPSRPTYDALFERSLAVNAVVEIEHKRMPFDVVHHAHLGGIGFHKPEGVPNVIRISSSTRLCHEMGGYGQNDEEMLQQVELETAAMQKADGIFGPSRMVAKLTEKELNKEVMVIETPFTMRKEQNDLKFFKDHLQNKKYLLFFGSVGRLKGAGTIADMLTPLLEKHPGLHFVFVGKQLPGPQGVPFMEYIFDKAQAVASRIIHLDKMQQKFLYPIIEGAEAVVLPSLIDNFPNSCIESMAHGKVVIGTQENGFEQLIESEQSGYLIPAGDADALLKACNQVMALTGEEQKQMGAKAKARIEDLEPEKVVAQLLDWYQQTISNYA